jgi:general secretion pathway protein K
MNKQQGMALVLVLWILSLLTIMAGSFALSMRRETAMISGLRNTAEAMATAESGLAIAEWMLQNPDPNKRWRADGSIYQVNAANAKLRIRLLSETGKININNADPALLQNAMNHAPNATDKKQSSDTINLAAAISDWSDSDELVRTNGAEKQQYQDAGFNYQPRNKPFQSLEELQMVLGMDVETFKWLEPLVTVYSDHTQVDAQFASKEVLELIPAIDTGMTDSYIAARTESARNNLPPPPSPLLNGQGMANAEVTVFTIVSEVQFNDQSTALINALVKKSDGTQTMPFQVLRWQSVTTNNESLFTNKMSELVVKSYAESEFNH